jgi:hypothetical protein
MSLRHSSLDVAKPGTATLLIPSPLRFECVTGSLSHPHTEPGFSFHLVTEHLRDIRVMTPVKSAKVIRSRGPKCVSRY